MAVGQAVSKIGKGQKSEGSGHNERYKCSLGLHILLSLNVYYTACFPSASVQCRAVQFTYQHIYAARCATVSSTCERIHEPITQREHVYHTNVRQ